MKIFYYLLFFTFTGMNFAHGQTLFMRILPRGIQKELSDHSKFDRFKYGFLDYPDLLLFDSLQVHFPEMVSLDMELNLSYPQLGQSSLPYIDLPPSQSRMPIMPFDASMNYTILRKQY